MPQNEFHKNLRKIKRNFHRKISWHYPKIMYKNIVQTDKFLISDFKFFLSPLCAIYANDTQKRTCVIQVSLFFDKMVGAVFPHFSHQKHVKTLGENTIQYKKRFIERMKWYFVSKIVLIYMRKTFANMIMKVDILFQQWKVSTSFEIKSVFF